MVVGFIVFYLLIPIRALRWRVLLENVGENGPKSWSLPSFGGLCQIVFLSWFANSVTVARLGDAYRAYLLRDSAAVSFTVTLGTLLAERILELTVMVAMLTGSLLVGFHGTLPNTVSQALGFGLACSILGIVCLVVMRRFRGVVERHLPDRFHDHYANLEHGTIDSFDRLPLLVGYSVLGWLIEGVVMYLVAVAVGTPIPAVSALVVALVAALVSTIPITVGGLGVAEASIVFVLQWVGLATGPAGAIALLSRFITYWCLVVVGGAVFVFTRLSTRDRFPRPVRNN